MNRVLVCLAVAITSALIITAGLQAQNADRDDPSKDEVQPAAFDEQATGDSADRKFPSAKPLLQGIFGRRSTDREADQAPNAPATKRHPKHAPTRQPATRQPTPVDSDLENVPRRVQGDATSASSPIGANLEHDPNEIASEPIIKESVEDASSSLRQEEEVRVSDDSSSRRAQQTFNEPAVVPIETVAPGEVTANDVSHPIETMAPAEVTANGVSQPINSQNGAWDDRSAQEVEQPSVASRYRDANAIRPPLVGAQSAGDDLLVSRKSAVLVVETLGPRDTVIGKEAKFQVKLSNLGDVPATGVDVRVKTPQWAEITAVNASLGAPSQADPNGEQPLIWRVDHLDAHGTALLNLSIIPRQSNPFDLAVAWTMQPTSSQTMIQVQEPLLDIGIAGPGEVRFGDTKIYTLTVSNPGTGDAENVKVHLMPIEGGDQPMAMQDLGTIRAGESTTLEVELTARQGGHINIDATATADLGLQAKASEEVLVLRANLTTDVIGPPVKYTGTTAEYKFRIANAGNASAENVKIAVKLPAGADFVDGTNGGRFDEPAKTVSWNVDDLPAQREMIFTVRTTLNQAGANVLTVVANADRELADSGSVSTVVETLADLKLEVSDPRGPLPVNEKMVYEVRLWNRGSKAARDVEVVAYFSEGVEPVSVEGGAHRIGNGQVLFNTIPMLGVGEEIKFTIAAKSDRGGNHIFRAEVQCRDAGTHLAAEETTHFYDKQNITSAASDATRTIRR